MFVSPKLKHVATIVSTYNTNPIDTHERINTRSLAGKSMQVGSSIASSAWVGLSLV